jgi:hypothetical protein
MVVALTVFAMLILAGVVAAVAWVYRGN